MSAIVGIHAREILDSRGSPTVETEVFLEDGSFGRAAVPSEASTGLNVLKAVGNVNEKIAPELIGMEVTKQALIDKAMIDLDGTASKSVLGANAILGVSIAVARAAAASRSLPLWLYLGGVGSLMLPAPMINVISGGAHANNAADFQEFMIIPHSAKSFAEALRMGTETYHALKRCLEARKYSTGASDDGAFAPDLKTNREALDLLMEAVEKAGYRPEVDISFALDVASSRLFKDHKYVFDGEGKTFTRDELIIYYEGLCRDYPIISIEDGMAEEDRQGWSALTKRLGDKIQLVGDAMFVTNPEIPAQGIREGAGNAVLVKLNQAGTVSEIVEVVQMATLTGYASIISHCSGETDDTFICDLSVAMKTGQIKTGSVARDRVAKYNQLLRIEEELGDVARYAGLKRFSKAMSKS